MKIDRLIGILTVLLQKERVTAPYLAEKFEVSRRTIQRDLEDLCRAGLPVVTAQGAGGGISIMEGYKIDRTLLTSADLQAILAGLRSLDSVSGTNRYGQLMEKLSPGASDLMAGDQTMLIDLSSWYRGTLTPKIETIHAAIRRRERVRFQYHAPGGESRRVVEPVYLVFRWSNWYVWGWCEERKDARLFKLNRITDLSLTGERFEKRDMPLPDFSADRVFPEKIRAKILFPESCAWRLIEEYGKKSFTRRPDGTLEFTFGFTNREHLLSWILTFGDQAELLEPETLREELAKIGKGLWQKYTGGKEE